jgi:hypothetical protein
VNAESMRNGRLQIAQDTLHCRPMNVPGVLHKLGNFVDRKCNIRTGKRYILKRVSNVSHTSRKVESPMTRGKASMERVEIIALKIIQS